MSSHLLCIVKRISISQRLQDMAKRGNHATLKKEMRCVECGSKWRKLKAFFHETFLLQRSCKLVQSCTRRYVQCQWMCCPLKGFFLKPHRQRTLPTAKHECTMVICLDGFQKKHRTASMEAGVSSRGGWPKENGKQVRGAPGLEL